MLVAMAVLTVFLVIPVFLVILWGFLAFITQNRIEKLEKAQRAQGTEIDRLQDKVRYLYDVDAARRSIVRGPDGTLVPGPLPPPQYFDLDETSRFHVPASAQPNLWDVRPIVFNESADKSDPATPRH